MIDIIIPAYKEGNNILKLFDEIAQKIQTPHHVMVICDMVDDPTIATIESNQKKYNFPLEALVNTYGRGALNAIKFGMDKATAEYVLVMMADSSDKLDAVDLMAAKMNEGYDLVCGSRYMKGGQQINSPFLKGFLSRMAGLSLHFFSRIPTHDVTNSFKMYRRNMLQNIKIESHGGFEIGMEITVKAYIAGYKITEIPSIWIERSEGKSNFRLWNWLPGYLHWYFLCCFKTLLLFLKNRKLP